MENFAIKIGNFVLETTRVIPVVLSIIVIALSILGYQLLRSGSLTTIEIQPNAFIAPVDKELMPRVDAIEQKLAAITSSLEKASGEQLTKVGVESLKKRLDEISSELESLDRVYTENPEKALAIPLLERNGFIASQAGCAIGFDKRTN